MPPWLTGKPPTTHRQPKMELTQLIKHPEQMDKETLYDLRSLLALYPYYQSARLLLLQNLYILHDSTFDEELRRAAIYITDRKVIFNLVEAAHYRLKSNDKKADAKPGENRTVALIDNFLDSIPADDSDDNKKKRKPTPADAAVDYVSYLLETESENGAEADLPQMKGQDLIDNFINNDGGSFTLQDEPEYKPEIDDDSQTDGGSKSEKGYYTETLAKIYIKQGQYSKALEIIRHLNLNNSKKSVYFADQIRFLDKLILNNKNK